MKAYRSSSILFLAFSVLSGCAHPQPVQSAVAAEPVEANDIAPCSPQTVVSQKCTISPDAVHPTQFAVGFKDVLKKRSKISQIKNDPKELKNYLKKKSPPAVKGPEDVFYIVDGHHTTRALSEESISAIYITLTKDYSDMTIADFWDRMKYEGLVWVYDENGVGPQDPIHIPATINELPDDPYRSLAEDAKQQGAYEEKPVFFQQFIWANFFRPQIPKQKLIDQYEEAVQDAVKLGHSPEAANLPGYKATQ